MPQKKDAKKPVAKKKVTKKKVTHEKGATKKSTRAPLDVIGWREWVCLPELKSCVVKAKVDTGARSSSIHAIDIRVHDEDGDNPQVSFKVHPLQDDAHKTVSCRLPLLDMRWVTSSNGKRQRRPVVETLVDFAGERWPIELTLTARDMMGFRMLLGREAIRGRFTVDAGRSFLAREHAPASNRRTRIRR